MQCLCLSISSWTCRSRPYKKKPLLKRDTLIFAQLVTHLSPPWETNKRYGRPIPPFCSAHATADVLIHIPRLCQKTAPYTFGPTLVKVSRSQQPPPMHPRSHDHQRMKHLVAAPPHVKASRGPTLWHSRRIDSGANDVDGPLADKPTCADEVVESNPPVQRQAVHHR